MSASYEQIRRMLDAHRVRGFNGTQTACWCDGKWRDNDTYRRHLADEIMVAELWDPRSVAIAKRQDQP